jgi:hypothetical protein
VSTNRDPSRLDNPLELRLDRKTCAIHGLRSRRAPPARAVRWHASKHGCPSSGSWTGWGDITVDTEKHGPVGDQNFNYEPTFVLRGLTDLHINFTPLG